MEQFLEPGWGLPFAHDPQRVGNQEGSYRSSTTVAPLASSACASRASTRIEAPMSRPFAIMWTSKEPSVSRRSRTLIQVLICSLRLLLQPRNLCLELRIRILERARRIRKRAKCFHQKLLGRALAQLTCGRRRRAALRGLRRSLHG